MILEIYKHVLKGFTDLMDYAVVAERTYISDVHILFKASDRIQHIIFVQL